MNSKSGRDELRIEWRAVAVKGAMLLVPRQVGQQDDGRATGSGVRATNVQRVQTSLKTIRRRLEQLTTGVTFERFAVDRTTRGIGGRSESIDQTRSTEHVQIDATVQLNRIVKHESAEATTECRVDLREKAVQVKAHAVVERQSSRMISDES
jgi:hypothetical protein